MYQIDPDSQPLFKCTVCPWGVLGRCLFKKEIKPGERAAMDGKKRGDDHHHGDHRLPVVEGSRNRRIQTSVEIRQVKRGDLRLEQPRYKHQEEIRVGENQRPGHNTRQAEFHFFCLFHFLHL